MWCTYQVGALGGMWDRCWRGMNEWWECDEAKRQISCGDKRSLVPVVVRRSSSLVGVQSVEFLKLSKIGNYVADKRTENNTEAQTRWKLDNTWEKMINARMREGVVGEIYVQLASFIRSVAQTSVDVDVAISSRFVFRNGVFLRISVRIFEWFASVDNPRALTSAYCWRRISYCHAAWRLP